MSDNEISDSESVKARQRATKKARTAKEAPSPAKPKLKSKAPAAPVVEADDSGDETRKAAVDALFANDETSPLRLLPLLLRPTTVLRRAPSLRL